MSTGSVIQGSQLFMLNPLISPRIVVVAAQVQGLSGIGGQKSSIKITNFDSPGYDEFLPGLTDPGKPGGNVVLNFNDTGHQLFQKLMAVGAGGITSFYWGASDGTAFPTVSASGGVGALLLPPTTGTIAAPVQAAAATATTGGTNAAATYYYKVTAFNALGETIASNEVNITTTGSTSTNTVNWATVAGATGFKIYRSTSSGTETFLASVGVVITYSDTGAATPTAVTPPTYNSTGTFSRSGWFWNGFVNEFSQSGQVNNVIMAKFGTQASGAIGMVVKGQSIQF